MLWVQLIIVFVILFAGLAYFFWHLLISNASKATRNLHELSKDLVAKEEEANRLLQNAQKEAKSIVARETEAAEAAKAKLIQEAQESREKILKEATQKSMEIAEKARRNAEFLRGELEQKIEERAREKVCDLIGQTIPREFLEELHRLWLKNSDKGELDLKHLKLPEKVKDAGVVSAFPLTDAQREDLKKKLKKKVGGDITLKTDVDPSLIAGYVITIGSVVVDASLKYRIEKRMRG